MEKNKMKNIFQKKEIQQKLNIYKVKKKIR